jgi:hypothetical protein
MIPNDIKLEKQFQFRRLEFIRVQSAFLKRMKMPEKSSAFSLGHFQAKRK